MTGLEKLVAKGLWTGPAGNIKEKLKYAYQIPGGAAFVGVFQKGTFEGIEGFKGQTLYLGKPGPLFQPVVGRDKVRDSNNELKVLETEAEVPIRADITPTAVRVKASKSVLTAYPLDHSRQNDIMIPVAFEGHDVHLIGAGVIGTELAVALCKMGLTKLTIYDPGAVEEGDPAVSVNRIFDVNRLRGEAAFEIIADQTLQTAEVKMRWPGDEDQLGNVVINTDASSRARVWELVRKNPNVGLYLDVQGSGLTGKIFAIDPSDAESVQLYEADLMSEYSSGTIAYVVKILAGFAAGAVQRYVGTPGQSQHCCLDRVYFIDVNEFYCSEGIWGKVGKR